MKKSYLQFFALALAWGTSFSLIKVALHGFEPIVVAFLRSFFGFLVLLVWCLFRSIKVPRWSMIWLHLAALSLLLNTLPNFLFAFAETHVSSTLAGLINATTPIFTVLLVAVILRSERLAARQVVGIVLGFIGILLLIEVWNGFSSDSATALLALFAGVLCFAISYPYINRYLKTRNERNEGLILVQVGISALSIFPFAATNNESIEKFELPSVIAVIVLGAFASGIAYVWNIEVTRTLGSAVSSSVSYLIPVVALVTGFLFMGEQINLYQAAGVVLIIFSLWFARNKVR